MLLPEGHRLARPVVVTIHDPVDEPFFLLDMPHSRDYFRSLFRLAGISPTVALELRSVEMIRSLVANGHVCCPFDSTVPAQRVFAAAPQTAQRPRPATAFLEVMRDRFMKS
ncbi:hypothetical protein IAG25_02655 [Caballeronia sp. EK]|nr:hypothetical protein [Caballeronia sp. EK]